MNDDKLPNYYDVSIEAWQWTPKPGMTVGDSRHFAAQAVEAADPQTAVRLTLNQQWGTCDIDEGDSGEGWVVHRVDDEEGPWLELDVVLNIQQRVNAAANGREGISLINEEEEARIRELWALNTWPNGWDGDEIVGDVPLDSIIVTDAGLMVQPLLIGK